MFCDKKSPLRGGQFPGRLINRLLQRRRIGGDAQSGVSRPRLDRRRAAEGEVPGDSTVVAELQAGRMINAIKLWRDYTGLGLAEAKAEMETLAARLGV